MRDWQDTTMAAIKGGDKMAAYLEKMVAKAQNATVVSVGWPVGADYPDGTPVALVAITHEFGGTVNIPEHEASIYRRLNDKGDFMSHGKFVKRSKSNYETRHTIPAHVITIPPRPYFRPMIAEKSGEWGDYVGQYFKTNKYDARKTLYQMGEKISGQLQDSILAVTSPALAQSTIKAKGFDKPLVGGANDSGGGGVMLRSVTYEVAE
jgi:hypothetical protein